MNKYKKALEFIKEYHGIFLCDNEKSKKSYYVLEKLVERATAKKPIGDLHSVPHYRCPICHGGVKMYEDSIVYPFCHHCGQALDWTNEG